MGNVVSSARKGYWFTGIGGAFRSLVTKIILNLSDEQVKQEPWLRPQRITKKRRRRVSCPISSVPKALVVMKHIVAAKTNVCVECDWDVPSRG